MRVGWGGVGGRALLLRARVRVWVHGREAGAALHQTVEIERDAVARRAYLYARYFVVAERFVIV